jgi:endonuclease/exonuclease/phosphatase family metal-dependent hydrolase
MGDLNADPDSAPLQALQQGPVPLQDSRSISGSSPVGPAGTWNGFAKIDNARRIDHVLVGPGVTVQGYETLDPRSPAGRFASDHLPVAVVARLSSATE